MGDESRRIVFSEIYGVSGFPILVVLGAVAAVLIVLTIRSSRPKNH
jgi:hypothetical protein